MLGRNVYPVKLNEIIDMNKNEVYIGDQTVIDILNDILGKIKNGYYDDITKQNIYEQNKIFVIDDDVSDDSENNEEDNENLKYYTTGWFIHNFFQIFNKNLNEQQD